MVQSPTYRLTDDPWQALRDVLPTNDGKRGGQWRDHRTMIDGILWALSDGGRWRNLPGEFGPWQSAYDRFRRWTRSGLWDEVLAALRQRKAEAGEIDGHLSSIDGRVVRAHVSAAGASKKTAPPASRPTTPSAAVRAGSAPRSTGSVTATACRWR
jgi:transposase